MNANHDRGLARMAEAIPIGKLIAAADFSYIQHDNQAADDQEANHLAVFASKLHHEEEVQWVRLATESEIRTLFFRGSVTDVQRKFDLLSR